MIYLAKFFVTFWKTLLVVAVFFVTFTSANIAISTWRNLLPLDGLENYLVGDKLLIIGDTQLKISIADTPDLRQKGLSGRNKMDDDQGLFFIFDESDRHGIWMKDMNFAIDIIWLDDRLQVIDVAEKVAPGTYPEIFRPKFPALYALEVNAGLIAKNGIKISDQITLLK